MIKKCKETYYKNVLSRTGAKSSAFCTQIDPAGSILA